MMTIKVKTLKHGIKDILFDDSDFTLLKKYSWCVTKIGHNFYTSAYDPNKYKITKKHDRVYMHRLLMGEHKGKHIDHINHNGLDNRRNNLRIVSPSVNSLNKGVEKANSTGFSCVTKRFNKYKASIRYNKKYIHGGFFKTPEEAFHKVQLMKNEIFQGI